MIRIALRLLQLNKWGRSYINPQVRSFTQRHKGAKRSLRAFVPLCETTHLPRKPNPKVSTRRSDK